jgi:hypothetical protein
VVMKSQGLVCERRKLKGNDTEKIYSSLCRLDCGLISRVIGVRYHGGGNFVLSAFRDALSSHPVDIDSEATVMKIGHSSSEPTSKIISTRLHI